MIPPRYEPRSYIKENKVNTRTLQPDNPGLSSSWPYVCLISRNLSASRESHFRVHFFGKLLRPRWDHFICATGR